LFLTAERYNTRSQRVTNAKKKVSGFDVLSLFRQIPVFKKLTFCFDFLTSNSLSFPTNCTFCLFVIILMDNPNPSPYPNPKPNSNSKSNPNINPNPMLFDFFLNT
jgi:hypothetical protein